MPEPATQLAYTRATLAAPPGEDGPIEFVASQPRTNRYGFKLRPDGWRLDNFQANPVFLWMHQTFMPPIGRADLRQQGGELRASVSFDQGDELARTVERKYRGGFLNAVSVGWGFVDKTGAPIKDWWRLTAEQIASPDVFYDLEEISGVSVPGDPRAVSKQQQRALARLGRELLDLVDDGPDPDELAERVRAEVTHQLDGFNRLRDPDQIREWVASLDDQARQQLAAFVTATADPLATDALAAAAGDPDPAMVAPPEPPAVAAPTFDPSAAQGVLAALAL